MNKTPRLSKPKRDSFQTAFHKTVPDVNETIWKEMIEYQDYDTIFFEIREDIINRTFEECYKNYLEKETVKFVTECSYSAWKEIVQLNFFIHDTRKKYSASLQSSWVADTEPLFCRPDSWSKGNIPLNNDNLPRDKMQQTTEVLSDYQLIKCTEYPTTNVFQAAKRDDVASLEGSLVTVTKPLKDADPSQLNVQFTNFLSVSREKLSVVVENEMMPRKTSENIFYKIMKINRSSLNSIPTSLKNVGKKNYPHWVNLDEVTEEPRKIVPAPLRLHVSTAVKLASMLRLSRGTAPRSVMFTEKSTKSETPENKD